MLVPDAGDFLARPSDVNDMAKRIEKLLDNRL